MKLLSGRCAELALEPNCTVRELRQRAQERTWDEGFTVLLSGFVGFRVRGLGLRFRLLGESRGEGLGLHGISEAASLFSEATVSLLENDLSDCWASG